MQETQTPTNYEKCLDEAKANMQIEGFNPQLSQNTVDNHVPNISLRHLRNRKKELEKYPK